MRARRRVLGREIQRKFKSVAADPVPEEFLDILTRIDESAAREMPDRA